MQPKLREQDKTRQDIYYHNIASTISWHAVSNKTLVEACQTVDSITKILGSLNILCIHVQFLVHRVDLSERIWDIFGIRFL